MKLRIIEQGKEDAVVDVSGDKVVIGRAPECDVVIKNGHVSRRHAELRSGVFVSDLESLGGTFVGGKRVTNPVALADHALLLGTDVRIEVLESASSGPATDGSELRALRVERDDLLARVVELDAELRRLEEHARERTREHAKEIEALRARAAAAEAAAAAATTRSSAGGAQQQREAVAPNATPSSAPSAKPSETPSSPRADGDTMFAAWTGLGGFVPGDRRPIPEPVAPPPHDVPAPSGPLGRPNPSVAQSNRRPELEIGASSNGSVPPAGPAAREWPPDLLVRLMQTDLQRAGSPYASAAPELYLFAESLTLLRRVEKAIIGAAGELRGVLHTGTILPGKSRNLHQLVNDLALSDTHDARAELTDYFDELRRWLSISLRANPAAAHAFAEELRKKLSEPELVGENPIGPFVSKKSELWRRATEALSTYTPEFVEDRVDALRRDMAEKLLERRTSGDSAPRGDRGARDD